MTVTYPSSNDEAGPVTVIIMLDLDIVFDVDVDVAGDVVMW